MEDSSGRSVWWAARVEPYGQVHVHPGSELELRLRWPGHYADPETGLYYNRHRYYDPVLGRYLQSDPLGLAGGLNLYAYAPNPLVHVDVLGLAHAKKGEANSVHNAETEQLPRSNAVDQRQALTQLISNQGSSVLSRPLQG